MKLTIDHTFNEPKCNGATYWKCPRPCDQQVCEELSIPEPRLYRWTPQTIAHEIAHARGLSGYLRGYTKGKGKFYWEVAAWEQAIEWLPLEEINFFEIETSLNTYGRFTSTENYLKEIIRLKKLIEEKSR